MWIYLEVIKNNPGSLVILLTVEQVRSMDWIIFSFNVPKQISPYRLTFFAFSKLKTTVRLFGILMIWGDGDSSFRGDTGNP